MSSNTLGAALEEAGFTTSAENKQQAKEARKAELREQSAEELEVLATQITEHVTLKLQSEVVDREWFDRAEKLEEKAVERKRHLAIRQKTIEIGKIFRKLVDDLKQGPEYQAMQERLDEIDNNLRAQILDGSYIYAPGPHHDLQKDRNALYHDMTAMVQVVMDEKTFFLIQEVGTSEQISAAFDYYEQHENAGRSQKTGVKANSRRQGASK